MKFGTDIQGVQTIQLNDFVHLAAISGQNFNYSITLVYDQISAKRMTFPSASSGVLCVRCSTENVKMLTC